MYHITHGFKLRRLPGVGLVASASTLQAVTKGHTTADCADVVQTRASICNFGYFLTANEMIKKI